MAATTLGEWHHFVGQYRAGFKEIYFDGQLVAQELAPAAPALSQTNIGIGGEPSSVCPGVHSFIPAGSMRCVNPDNSRVLNGRIDELRVYGRALTEAEVSILSCPDEDGDAVIDDEDLCPGTLIQEATVPSVRLATNRWALVGDDLDFDTESPQGKGPQRSYSTADTGGCSCEQIIEVQSEPRERPHEVRLQNQRYERLGRLRQPAVFRAVASSRTGGSLFELLCHS